MFLLYEQQSKTIKKHILEPEIFFSLLFKEEGKFICFVQLFHLSKNDRRLMKTTVSLANKHKICA